MVGNGDTQLVECLYYTHYYQMASSDPQHCTAPGNAGRVAGGQHGRRTPACRIFLPAVLNHAVLPLPQAALLLLLLLPLPLPLPLLLLVARPLLLLLILLLCLVQLPRGGPTSALLPRSFGASVAPAPRYSAQW